MEDLKSRVKVEFTTYNRRCNEEVNIEIIESTLEYGHQHKKIIINKNHFFLL